MGAGSIEASGTARRTPEGSTAVVNAREPDNEVVLARMVLAPGEWWAPNIVPFSYRIVWRDLPAGNREVTWYVPKP
jgi:hypothetical protein